MKIILKEFGARLLLRKQVQNIRKIAIQNSYRVIFDMNGIEMINNSVADEIFWKWIEEYWRVFSIEWVSDKFIQENIITAMKNRSMNIA